MTCGVRVGLERISSIASNSACLVAYNAAKVKLFEWHDGRMAHTFRSSFVLFRALAMTAFSRTKIQPTGTSEAARASSAYKNQRIKLVVTNKVEVIYHFHSYSHPFRIDLPRSHTRVPRLWTVTYKAPGHFNWKVRSH